ncbi:MULTISPECIES: 2-oxo-4-hydroxy-4-carboxy-5-ureidoimidazoline decarboxylase [Comamonas]|uniref:N-carbamoyl-L-amino acid hydrolase n=1 Tax=Comamonas testosteroni TaxID=285 RepID=A0A8B4SA72_COMTE|nr:MULTISPECIES: 2-oxo-4-hydroxy-4-carboxy-5-ureidoimidazoline decarboxylase [Comamonas]QQN72087.1 2-oxo-4-hydroxy-4-carboxy-5-ureidoimidazoline decarboxylase [Comamonas testosteroni]RDI04563.1 N-carbamoyl-L-amino-acid hydrolase [Comamonas sp. AG1104]SUY79225.1 N-carbamoyl-L-amino acid hydrolase [Comamonas testosteroni]
MALTLEQLNAADAATATDLLDGLYEHSPWIAAKALEQRPFKSMAHIKHAMAKVLAESSEQAQLDLIRAHPELAGKQMETNTLTAESTNEQKKAGLTNCTPEELEHIRKLNAEYGKRFGFPFILAVRGARGLGLSKAEIIATFERRMFNHPAYEQAEALRNIHRIAEIRLNDKFGYEPVEGNEVWDWQERLSTNSDPGYAEKGQLTVTYLTDAHRACAQRISHWMREIGFDEVEIDAVGNVVGRYKAATEGAKTLLTGSHYDTVRNGGKYDGRLGIFVPMACVKQLAQQGKRLPFNIEVVGFSEEEGQRYKATFLGSGALVGDFKQEWLEQKDADGITLREAMLHAGLCIDDIPKLERDPAKYLGFVEVHIEQGPVLNELDIPLGIVTSINGSARYTCEFIGMASHAGTTPMDRRRDAAAGVAELSLYIEKRAGQDGDSVATIGQLNVPSGSVNVVPGRCQFSLDLRAPTNEQRDAMINDIMAEMAAIAERRGLRYSTDLSMKAAAAPSAPEWQKRWENAVDALGVPLFRMPSGAGHDAMKLHEIMPQAMLFVRGMNAGISHNPLEASTSDDMQLSVDAFTHLLHQLAQEQQ